MKPTPKYTTLPALTLTVLLTACGGGGGGGGGDGGSGTSPATTSGVLSSGVITQFGSVHVNGVRYDTTNTQVISADDGSIILENPTDNTQLRQYLALGQVVKVRGSSNDDGSNGVASAVIIDNELVGPIDSVSAADGTFVVLGQTVAVTPDTIIDDSIIEAVIDRELADDVRFADIEQVSGQSLTLDQLLSVAMVVEVNGFPSQNGIEATRIEDVDNRDRRNHNEGGNANGEAEVKGFVTNLDASQFEINGLTVFYDEGDLDSEDFSDVEFAEGQYVEVKGNVLSSTSIDANRIELEDDLFDDDDDSDSNSNSSRIEIEGVISAVRPDDQGSGGVIVINGMEITVDDISMFSEGQRVEIKGRLQNGVLVINRIKEEVEDTVRIEDRTASTDGTSITTRLGIIITPSDRTRLDDKAGDDDNATLLDFITGADGNYIKARGFPMNGGVTWTRVRIDDDDDEDCRLRGPVDDITGIDASDFSFVIQGVTIDVSEITSFDDFQNGSDTGVGRDAFFDQLDEGDIVQAQSIGNATGCMPGLLTAREVEFERADNSFSDDDDNDDNDDAADNDNDDGADNEITGTVSSVSDNSFVVNGETITVTDSTLIDDSIIEAARGVELDGDRQLSTLPETLTELLSVGLNVEVEVDRSNGVVATRIEDR